MHVTARGKGTAGALVLGLLLGACADRGAGVLGSREAVAELRTARGESAGSARLREENGRVRIDVQAEGLTPGPHGIHIHQVGQCAPSDFESAAIT